MTMFKNQVEELSISECMKKWKALRDKFVRELIKVKLRKSGDSGPKYVSCCAYFDNMFFFEGFSLSQTVRYFQFYLVSTYKHLLHRTHTHFSQDSETFQTLVDTENGLR